MIEKMNKSLCTLILAIISLLPGYAQGGGGYRMSVVDSMLNKALNADPDAMQHLYDGPEYYLKKIDGVYDQLKSEYICDQVLSMFRFPACHDMSDYLAPYLKRITVDSLRNKVEAALVKHKQEYGAIFPGQVAPDFTFTNEKGKVFKLSDLRGRLLFIDIWGTWCAPCIEEIPYLAKLQEKYKNNKNVLIMSLACDKESARDKWKAFLKKHKEMTWAQYQVTDAGNKILDDVYHVIGIPRFMIIEKNGVIIDADTQRPSFQTFDKFFEEIVNKQ